MSEYIPIVGDTFESISRKSYGTEQRASLIASANPGIAAPVPGWSLVIPRDPDQPRNAIQFGFSLDPDATTVFIAGKRFQYWEKISITRTMDSIDQFSFSAPFEPDSKAFRESFVPFQYAPVEVNVGEDAILTGSMVKITPEIDKDARKVDVKGYSLPGVLQDCTAPESISPLEFNDQGLQDIAKTLCLPFGIGVKFEETQGAIFDQVASDAQKKVFDFLVELAAQRNLVITNTVDGDLLFWRSVQPGKPVAKLVHGESPVLSVKPRFSEQEYYSHITGVEPAILFGDPDKYTVKNPRLNGVMRPLVYNVNDTLTGDMETAVKTKMARMFANMCAYQVTVPTWRDPQGKLWEPNTTVTLDAPGSMVYGQYEFVIRSVTMTKSNLLTSATLELIIPGSLAGQLPERLPWEE